jgi:hypothetical protein
VYNYAYGSNKTKRKLQIPFLNNYRLDNLSGIKKKEIIESLKINFSIKKINFVEQKIRYTKNTKKYDFIKIDCETNFYDVIKSLSNNFNLNTIIMIECNIEMKKIYKYLKKKNTTYEGYYHENKILKKLNNYSDKNIKVLLDRKIDNIIFLTDEIFINQQI